MQANISNDVILCDVECHGCAYNLRSLPVDGRCPECGAPIKVSLAGDALQFANPDWLDRIALGTRLCGILVLSSIAIILVSGALGLVFGIGFNAIGVLIATFVVAIAGIIGFWLFSTPNPALSNSTEPWNSPRRFIRIGIVGTLLTIVASCIPIMWTPIQKGLWLDLVGGPFGFLGFLGLQGVCGYSEELSRRMNDVLGVGKGVEYGRGYRKAWIITALGTIVALLTRPQYGALLYVPGLIGMMYFGILSFLLPSMISRDIAEYRDMAEKVWAEAMQDSKRQDSHKPNVL